MNPARSGVRLFWIVVAIAILAGVVFRIEHVERRQLKLDESISALRVSGHTEAEVEALFDDHRYSADRILQFQRSDRSEPLIATVSGLANEEPHTAPLFYLIDRAWAAIAGSSIPSLRLPALLFSVGAIAAIYWFCFELTRSTFVGGSAAALMAVSPFFVNYGGQARQYSLWIAMIAVTSALLLRALHESRPTVWIWYGVTLALLFYSDPLGLCVLAAHAAFVLVYYRRDRSNVVSFGIAAIFALVAFLPWMVIAIRGHSAIERGLAWTHIYVPLRAYVRAWYFNIAAVLFDAEWAYRRLSAIAAAAALLLTYAFYRAQRDESGQTAWFLATLALAIALPEILLDVATHRHGSTIARYLVPLWIVMLVSVAIFFGRRLATEGGRLNASWFGAFCAVLGVAGASTAINSSAIVWWDNHDFPSAFMGRTIAATNSPLVLNTENPNPVVLVMSHYVAPTTQFLLFKSSPAFPLHLARNSFLLAPSKRTLAVFRKHPRYLLQRVTNPAGWPDYELFRISETSSPRSFSLVFARNRQ